MMSTTVLVMPPLSLTRYACAHIEVAPRCIPAVLTQSLEARPPWQLNFFCVTHRSEDATSVRWPTEHVTFRGTAMPRIHRTFFQAGKKYRAPMFVATSFDKDTAVRTFLMRLDPPTAEQSPPFQEATLWRFHLDGATTESQRCKHVNYIDRTDGTVHGEDEFLFSPYSVFTVRATPPGTRPRSCMSTLRRCTSSMSMWRPTTCTSRTTCRSHRGAERDLRAQIYEHMTLACVLPWA